MKQSEFHPLFVCPKTHQKLREASAEENARLNRQFPDLGTESFFIREDERAAWPVLGGIPSLVPSAMLELPEDI